VVDELVRVAVLFVAARVVGVAAGVSAGLARVLDVVAQEIPSIRSE
jgi:hypothetical protein